MKPAVSRLRLHSPAKVNLGLWVGPRRQDGFHDIVTIMVPLEFGDTVTIERARSGVRVSSSDPRLGDGPDNLAFRAAERFFAAARIIGGCRIHINKRIPLGSGLGGGSSNAATVLSGLNRLHGNALSDRKLHSLSTDLGSDVPAFLRAGASVARGRGEKLRPVRLPGLHVLLHFPGYPVATSWAYSALDRWRERASAQPPRSCGRYAPGLTSAQFSPKLLAAKLRQGELAGAGRLVRNSFEPVVFKRHPGLALVKQLLLDSGCYSAALSGSGSTVFGLFERSQENPMAALRKHGVPFILTRSI